MESNRDALAERESDPLTKKRLDELRIGWLLQGFEPLSLAIRKSVMPAYSGSLWPG